MSEQTPIQGVARVRRMGQFGEKDTRDIREVAMEQGIPVHGMEIAEDMQPQDVKTLPSNIEPLVALIVILLGVVIVTVGVSLIFGIAVGITTLGALVLSLGITYAFTL